VNKADLMKKLDAAVDEAMRHRLYGNIELEFKAGEPTYLKKLATEKLDEPGGRNDYTFRR
jgi:hypothetical protein